jgi:hypothetical protein
MGYQIDTPLKIVVVGTETYLVCEDCKIATPHLIACCRCIMVVCEDCWPKHKEHGKP